MLFIKVVLAIYLMLFSLVSLAKQIDSEDIEIIEVRGRAQTLYKESSTSVTRLDLNLEEIPQSIQIINNELFNDQAARKITDLYGNIAGVNEHAYSRVVFRGFRQDEVLFDGVKGGPLSGLSVPQLFNIDKVVVLKGPSSAIFGGAAPGGLINYVTKKPSFEAKNNLDLEVGNFNFSSLALESQGTVLNSESQAYRIGLYRDSEKPFRENTKLENQIADLGYMYEFKNHELTLQYTKTKQDFQGARLRGITVDENGDPIASLNFNFNEKSDFQNVDSDIYQLIHKWQPNDSLNFNTTVRYFNNNEEQEYHEPRGLVDTDEDGVVDFSRREFRLQLRNNQGLNIVSYLTNRYSLAGIENNAVVGFDYYDFSFESNFKRARQDNRGGPVPGISIINPEYGLTSRDDYGLEEMSFDRAKIESTRYAFYAQNKADLTDKLSLTVGLRYDNFTDNDTIANAEESSNNLTYRLGVTYKVNEKFYPYALYATGFLPQNISNQEVAVGGPFEAEKSTIAEVGVKSKLLDERIAINLASYEITRSNIIQETEIVSEEGKNQLTNIGEVQSRGTEVEIVGDITPSWVITANYAYNDTNVVNQRAEFDGQATGTSRFANSPRNTAGLWSRHELGFINSSVSYGLSYVDEQLSIDGVRVKPYTIYNLALNTHVEHWVFQLNFKNVFDKDYLATALRNRTGHFPGEPRRIFFKAQYNF